MLQWWTEVPDLTLSVCPLLLDTKNKKVAGTVVTQAIFAAGAHLIEHPQATAAELSLAGVEGALRTYTNALAKNPKMRDKFLDGLIAAQAEGKLLETYVTPHLAECDEAEREKREKQ